LLAEINLTVEAFDAQSFAVWRGFSLEFQAKAVCVIDIGRTSTTIAITNNGNQYYTRSINLGGDNITKSLMESFQIPEEEAEKKKREIAVSSKDEKSFLSFQKVLDPIVNEARTAIEYVKGKYNIELEDVVLVGGSSQLKGLVDYIKFNINKTVHLGSPRVSVMRDREGNESSLENILLYTEAVGLAIKGLGGKLADTDLSFMLPEEEVAMKEEERKQQQEEEGEKEEKTTWMKEHPKEKQLAVILAIGIVLLIGAFWYRSKQREDRQQKQQITLEDILDQQTVNIILPLAVNKAAYTENTVRGRVPSNSIEAAGSYQQALTFSRSLIEQEVADGEVLWSEPLNKLDPSKELTFPISVQWLMYQQEDVDRLTRQAIRENITDREFIIENILFEKLEATENPSVTQLIGTATISIKKKPVEK